HCAGIPDMRKRFSILPVKLIAILDLIKSAERIRVRHALYTLPARQTICAFVCNGKRACLITYSLEKLTLLSIFDVPGDAHWRDYVLKHSINRICIKYRLDFYN